MGKGLFLFLLYCFRHLYEQPDVMVISR